MMLIQKENEVFFIDRENSIFQVSNIKFPTRKDMNKHLTNTLMDGVIIYIFIKCFKCAKRQTNLLSLIIYYLKKQITPFID